MKSNRKIGEEQPAVSVCPGCGQGFTCGMASGASQCWCAELPPLLAMPRGDAAVVGCYCPACLGKMVAQVGSA